jgi:hypothetical protein
MLLGALLGAGFVGLGEEMAKSEKGREILCKVVVAVVKRVPFLGGVIAGVLEPVIDA